MTDTPYKPVPFSIMMDGPTEVDWLVDGIMPRTTTGIVAGEPGIGKTWIVMDFVLALASGAKWLDRFETIASKVLVVDEENAHVLIRRRYVSLAWRYKEFGKLDNIDFLVGNSIDITPLEHRTKGLQASSDFTMLYNTIATGGYEVVVFDSLTRMHHADENDSSRMSAVFGYVKRLMDDLGVSCLFTHHFNKSKGHNNNRLRGSSDILAFPDYVLRVETGRGHVGLSDNGVVIEHGKSRWDENIGRFYVKLDDGEDKDHKWINLLSGEDLEAALLVYLAIARTKKDIMQEMEQKGLGNAVAVTRMLANMKTRRLIYNPSRGVYQCTGDASDDDIDDVF